MSGAVFRAPPPEMLDEIHAKQRAEERYGVKLSDADRGSMKRQIKEARAVFLSSKTGSRHVKVWLVWWPSAARIVPVYYHAGRIKSVLPSCAVSQLIEKLERDLAKRITLKAAMEAKG